MEGKRAGIEEELVVLLGEYRLSGEGTRPVTYAGGIRSLEDLELVKQLGKGQVIFTDSRLFFLATKIMIIIIITLRCVIQSPSVFFWVNPIPTMIKCNIVGGIYCHLMYFAVLISNILLVLMGYLCTKQYFGHYLQ